MSESLLTAARLGVVAEEMKAGENVLTAAILNFTAVLCVTEDVTRMRHLGIVAQELAKQSLKEFERAGPEKVVSVEDRLEDFIQQGIVIAMHALRDRDWQIAAQSIARVAYLDDLLARTKSGEIIPADTWPDVVG